MTRIRVERHPEHATITLDRPDRGNALSVTAWTELAQAVRALDEDASVRAIVIRGEGSDFSTGVDLADTWAQVGRVDPSEITTDAERALRGAGTPTIAQIRGNCVGGGLMIAAACDFRVAAADARFALTPARLGLIYPASSVQVIVQLAGASIARRMLVAGDWLCAQEALRAGLVDYLCDERTVDEETSALVGRLSALSPISQAAANDFIDTAYGDEDGMQATRRWESLARSHPDQARRIDGFLQRKSPAHRTS